MKYAKKAEQPHDYDNNHHNIQYRLNRRSHGYEAVNEPEHYPDDDQNQHHIN